MKKDIRVKEGPFGPAVRLLWKAGAFVARRLFNRKLNLHFENWDLFDTLEPPFLIVGNHVTNYDPVLISANQRHMIHWVAGDAVFRHPVLRWIFTILQVIPKTKGTSDLETVRAMHLKIREGDVVGVYPEGQTSWDGLSQEPVPSTAKLLKLFKVPVVTVLNKGGYTTKPRWSWKARRSRMVLEACLLFKGDELKNMPVEEIEERLKAGIFHDDFLYRREEPVALETKAPAETLELYTYVCPRCETVASLESSGAEVRCRSCGWSFEVDSFGRFPEKSEHFPFASLAEWGRWQRDWCAGRVESFLASEDGREQRGTEVLIEDEGLTLLTGAGLVPLKVRARGDLSLYSDRLELRCDGDAMVFSLKEIEALSIFKQQRFEFYRQGVLYRFQFPRPGDSAYKWVCFLEEMISRLSGD